MKFHKRKISNFSRPLLALGINPRYANSSDEQKDSEHDEKKENYHAK